MIIERIIHFITTQSVGSRNLSLSTRYFRFVLLLVILAIPTLLCGFLVNFKVAFQMWLLILAAIVPLVGGFFLIWKYQGINQRTTFLLATGVIGFTAFEWSLVGMLIDERSSNFSWTYILSNAFFTGIAFLIISTIGSLLFTWLFRVRNSKK
jgi:FtsH-binding integral membrane protein